MAKTGWIKFYRKILDWEWFDDANTFRVFVYCLLKANTEDKKWKGLEIKRGTFVTSVSTISKDLKISAMQTRTAIGRLILTNEITKSTTSTFTLIQVNNYNAHQAKQQAPQQTDNKRITTTKNNKKNKNTDTMVKTPTAFMTESNFEDFWKEYPRKEKKALARTKFLSLKEKLLPQIMGRLEDFKKSEDWKKDNGRFIPHPITWLNQKRFEDEVVKKEPEGRKFNFVN